MAKRRPRSEGTTQARREYIDDLLTRTELVLTAKALGLALSNEQGATAKTLCPFHRDTRPSLVLFRKSGAEPHDHFHCFSCNAHGDAISLVKEVKNCDFTSALQWLAIQIGFPPPNAKQRPIAVSNDKRRGYQLAEAIYNDSLPQERQKLTEWIDTRHLSEGIATAANLHAPDPSRLSDAAAKDRELLDAFLDCGLVVHTDHGSRPSRSLFPLLTRDYFTSKRILFPLHDDRGLIVGYAGRALGRDEPKYLYTRGLARTRLLYRLDAVRARVLGSSSRHRTDRNGGLVHVFLVEGLVDALRLEMLGFNAIAVLGSSLTEGQATLILRLATDLESSGRHLALHIFFDEDDAGRRGTMQALGRLLSKAGSGAFLLVDVVYPQGSGAAHDPDELFRDVADSDAAWNRLTLGTYPALSAMLASAWNVPLPDLDAKWKARTYAQEAIAFREIEQKLPLGNWPNALARFQPTRSWITDRSDALPPPWVDAFERFVQPTRASTAQAAEEEADKAPPPSEIEQLQRAVQLAYSSTQRRELPVDEGSWQRIQIALDAFVPYFRECLNKGLRPVEPFIANKVPRPDGRFRLKALAAPEELSLQQYMLVELLRDYREASDFLQSIPAVRYSRQYGTPAPITTGMSSIRTHEGRTVSFAYQVDMDVVEGLLPPRYEGIFRPYYHCWLDFIRYLDNSTNRIISPLLYVARLDIRRFYDALRRTAINDVLFPSLLQALSSLKYAHSEGTKACASAFLPTIEEPEGRAQRIVDWLCDQSFGFNYLRPEDGSVCVSDLQRGVPQGPDLSAYLANISLFPLDRRADNAALGSGAVYARYVDDIVIAAPTAHALREVRGSVEDELSRLGLELNDKSQQMAPMSREEFREWLTSRRGGLGASGPFAGPPLTEPSLSYAPWDESETLGRDKVLRILHDASHLCAPPAVVEAVVHASLRSDDLRHRDQIKAAALLWRCAGSKAAEVADTDIAAVFSSSWQRATSHSSVNVDSLVGSSSAKQADAASATLFTWLDGLDAFLNIHPRFILNLPTDCQEQVCIAQKAIAARIQRQAFTADLTRNLANGAEVVDTCRHIVLLKLLQAVLSSLRITTNENAFTLESLGMRQEDLASPAIFRLILSIVERADAHALLEGTASHTLRGTQHTARLLLHEAISRLRSGGAIGIDPLAEMTGRVSHGLSNADKYADEPLWHILSAWLPGDNPPLLTAPDGQIDAAITTFVNVSKERTPELMCDRPSFAQRLLHSKDETVRLIPGPPGTNVPGLIAVKDGTEARKRDFRDGAVVVPTTLEWTPPRGGDNVKWKSADLGSQRVVIPPDSLASGDGVEIPKSKLQQTKWLAEAFSSLATREDQRTACPVTPFNLLANADQVPSGLIGYRTTDAEGRAIATSDTARYAGFVRTGKSSLRRLDVPQFYGWLWEIGTALSDLLGYSHRSDLFDGNALSSAGTGQNIVEALADKLLRITSYRLRGSWNPTEFTSEDEHGWPRTVSRAIANL